MNYQKTIETSAFDRDHVGREYLRLRHMLRYLVEQTSLSELQSIVRMLVRSGFETHESIVSELEDTIGWFMVGRVEMAISLGTGSLWEDDGERLYLINQ